MNRPSGLAGLAVLLAWAVLALARAGFAAESAPPLPGILLLTSYHQGDAWNDRTVAGFLEALPGDAAAVYVEHLDSRRFAAEEFAPEFSAFLARKYARTPIRLLVAADDAALRYWMLRGEALFPGRPVVFCGVNDFAPDRVGDRRNVTGVAESPDVLGTLEMALALVPKAETIVAVGGEGHLTDQATLQRFRRAMLALGRRARAVEIRKATPEQIRKIMATLPRDAIVLRLGALVTARGELVPRHQSSVLLAQASPVPVFSLWDYDCGSGAVGGRVVSAEAQGRAAAGLAVRVLAGEAPETIPVMESPSQAMVDSRAMARFSLSSRNLPAGTILQFEPASAYERNKPYLWSAGVALTVLIPVSLLLSVTLAGRQAAEAKLRESESRYRELVENANSLILRFDGKGRLVFVNEYAERLLGCAGGAPPESLGALRATGPADLSALLARALVAAGSPGEDVAENEIMTRDGRRVFVRWDSRVLRDAAGEVTGWLAVGADITARRRAEEGLAARMLADEELLAFGRELLADAPGALARALRRLLTAFSVDRVAVFDNFQDQELGPSCRLAAEAFSPGLAPQLDNPVMARLPYSLDSFAWADRLGAGETIAGLSGEFPLQLVEILQAFQVQAVAAAPVTVDGIWSGVLFLGDTRHPRRFTRQEQTQLAVAASMLSAYRSRPRTDGPAGAPEREPRSGA